MPGPYFIDSALGNDGNNGQSTGTAWASFSRAQSTVVPGDTVNVRPGSGYGGGAGQITLSTSGTAGNYIVYRRNPGDAMPVITGSSSYNTVQITGHYIQIDGFEIAGINSSITASGAWANAAVVAASGNANDSAPLYNGDGVSAADVPTFSHAYVAALSTSTTTLTLDTTAGLTAGCGVFDSTNNTRIPVGTQIASISSGTVLLLTKAATGVVNGDSIFFAGQSYRNRVYNCNIHDFPKCGISAFLSDSWDIQGCYIHDNAQYWINGPSGISIGFGFDFDTTAGYHSQVIGNILWNNQNKIASLGISRSGPFTSSGTSTGTTLTLTGSPGTGVIGWQVFDTTTPGSSGAAGTVTPYTTVTNVSGGTITLSLPLNASLAAGHTIYFGGFTDGEGCLIDTNNGSYFGSRPTTMRTLMMNNVTFNNGSSGLQAYKSNNVDVVFNTFYNDCQDSLLRQSNGEFTNYNCIGCNVFNNIMYTSIGALTVLTENNGGNGNTFGNNLIFGGNGTVPPGTGNVTGSDPLFISAGITAPTITFPILDARFGLKSGSLARNSASASFTRTTDILGNNGNVGTASDMGAYEARRVNFVRHRR